MSLQKESEWEKVFDGWANNVIEHESEREWAKFFIRQTLTQREKEIAEEVRKEIERLPIFPTDTANGGYRNAMEKVLSIINKTKS